MWYHEHIGGGRCPIVDTWWQTETGAIMISPLPGRHHAQAGLGHVPAARASAPRSSTTTATASSGAAATSRSPGRGRRCCAASTATPSATSETYWSPVRGPLLRRRRLQARRRRLPLAARPGRRRDERVGPPHLHHRGRVARSSTTRPWPRPPWSAPTTPSPARRSSAYVIAAGHATTPSDELGEEVRQHVATKLGAIARPKTVIFTDDLPKTRSGKIMRRLLRDVAEGRDLGDTTTLADPAVVEEIKRRAAEAPDGGLTCRRPRPLALAGRAGRARARRRVRHGRRAVRRRRPPALPRAAAARLGRLLRGVRRGPAHRRGRPPARAARPDLRDRAAHRPADPGAAPDARPGSTATSCAGTCWSCATGATTAPPASSSGTRCTSCARYGFDLRLAFEDDRRNVEMFHREGVPCVYIHSGYYD